MVAMSRTAAHNLANANRPPDWLKGAALASGIASGATMSAAAFDIGADGSGESGTLIGAQYLTERNSGQSTGPISINMTFNGTISRQMLPELHTMKNELLEELQDLLEDSGRAAQRREHS